MSTSIATFENKEIFVHDQSHKVCIQYKRVACLERCPFLRSIFEGYFEIVMMITPAAFLPGFERITNIVLNKSSRYGPEGADHLVKIIL